MLLFYFVLIIYWVFSLLKGARKLNYVNWSNLYFKIKLIILISVLIYWKKQYKPAMQKTLVRDPQTNKLVVVIKPQIRRKWYDPTYSNILHHKWFDEMVAQGLKKKNPKARRQFFETLLIGRRDDYALVNIRLFRLLPPSNRQRRRILILRKAKLLKKKLARLRKSKKIIMRRNFSQLSSTVLDSFFKINGVKTLQEKVSVFSRYGFVVKKALKNLSKKRGTVWSRLRRQQLGVRPTNRLLKRTMVKPACSKKQRLKGSKVKKGIASTTNRLALLTSPEMCVTKVRRKWSYVKPSIRYQQLTMHPKLLKMGFGPFSANQYIASVEPFFFSAATLLKAQQSSFEEQMSHIFQLARDEQMLINRWKQLAAYDNVSLMRTRRTNPVSQYWNLKQLTHVLRSHRLSLLKSDCLDMEFVLTWFKNYKQVTIIMRNQDLTYEEALLWFEQYPWLVREPNKLAAEPSVLFENKFFDIDYKYFKIENLTDVALLRTKYIEVLKSEESITLRRSIFGLFAKFNFGILFSLDELAFRLLAIDIWRGCQTALVTCLVAYPELRESSINVIWNRVLNYVYAEFFRTVQILKAAVNNIRIVHIVQTLTRLCFQIKRRDPLLTVGMRRFFRQKKLEKVAWWNRFFRQGFGMMPGLKLEQTKLSYLIHFLPALRRIKLSKITKFKKRSGGIFVNSVVDVYQNWKKSVLYWRMLIKKKEEEEKKKAEEERKKKKKEIERQKWEKRRAARKRNNRFYSSFIWLKNLKRILKSSIFLVPATNKTRFVGKKLWKRRVSWVTRYMHKQRVRELRYNKRWKKLLRKLRTADLNKIPMPNLEFYEPKMVVGEKKTYLPLPYRVSTRHFLQLAKNKNKKVFIRVCKLWELQKRQVLLSAWWWEKLAWDLAPLTFFNRNWYAFRKSGPAYRQSYEFKGRLWPAFRVANLIGLRANRRRLLGFAKLCSLPVKTINNTWQFAADNQFYLSFWDKEYPLWDFYFTRLFTLYGITPPKISIITKFGAINRVVKKRRFYSNLFLVLRHKVRYWKKTGKKPWRRRRRLFKRARWFKNKIKWSRLNLKRVFYRLQIIKKPKKITNQISLLRIFPLFRARFNSKLQFTFFKKICRFFNPRVLPPVPFFAKLHRVISFFPVNSFLRLNLSRLVISLYNNGVSQGLYTAALSGVQIPTLLLPSRNRKRYFKWLKKLCSREALSKNLTKFVLLYIQYLESFFSSHVITVRQDRLVLHHKVKMFDRKLRRARSFFSYYKRLIFKKQPPVLSPIFFSVIFSRLPHKGWIYRRWLGSSEYSDPNQVMVLHRFFNEVTLRTLYDYMHKLDHSVCYSILLFNYFNSQLDLSDQNLLLHKVAKESFYPSRNSNYDQVRFWQYLNLLKFFYKKYYNNKKAKNLPNNAALDLIYTFFFLTAKRDAPYLNKRRDKKIRILKLVLKAPFTNRRTRGAVRHKKGLFKIKILFDRLFVWLYNETRVRFIFGTKIKKMYTLPLSVDSNILYRRSKKIFIK